MIVPRPYSPPASGLCGQLAKPFMVPEFEVSRGKRGLGCLRHCGNVALAPCVTFSGVLKSSQPIGDDPNLCMTWGRMEMIWT